MVSTNQFRNGTKVELDSEPFVIIHFQHVKPGKGGAFVRTKLKNLKTGSVLDRTFRSGETLKEPDIDEREMQFLYAQGTDYHFMDTSNYEQLSFDQDQLRDCFDLLKEGITVSVLIYQGRPISIELPNFIELAIRRTDPGIKGDTASGGTKPAVLESGATVKVPLYLEEGDLVKVDTRTRVFVERVK